MNASDDLKKLCKEIEETAQSCGIEIIQGSIRTAENSTAIFCSSESEDCARKFILQAKKVGALAVVLDVGVLEKSDLNDALDMAESAEEGESRNQILSTLQECKNKLGEIAILTASYVLPGTGVVVEFELAANWNAAVYDTEVQLDQEEDNENTDYTQLSFDEIEQVATDLANMPQFQSARNNGARALKARKYLQSKFTDRKWDWQVAEIIQAARSIYESEIKTAADAELARKAEEMLDEGKTKSEVARQLGLTVKQLANLI